MKNILILGSTGSVGKQAVEIAGLMSDEVKVIGISANSNGELLAEQSIRLDCRFACLVDENAANRHKNRFAEIGAQLFQGVEGLVRMIDLEEIDLVLNATLGSAGLIPTLEVIKRGITLALANKESLVAGGELVAIEAGKSKAGIIPVDSEHSAVFQCLRGERFEELKRIILTASGGPFRKLSQTELEFVTLEQTLAHPTWSMGRKITVDSATLMNKGLEVLEAHHLFSVEIDNISVLVHPQSVVHSMVEFIDGSVIAQLGVPDMRTPIQFALTWPERWESPLESLSFRKNNNLTFEEVDRDRFPCLEIAIEAGRNGQTYPAAMNAANEEAVAAFINGRTGFMSIPSIVEEVLEEHEPLSGSNLDEIQAAEESAREAAKKAIRSRER